MVCQDKWVIIPNAGNGQRFGEKLPKQYTCIQEKTVIEHTLSIFLEREDIHRIIVPLSEDDYYFEKLPLAQHPKVQTIQGGKTRAESVFNALLSLKSIAKPQEWVLVHDAVRPCLHERDLNALIEALQEDKVGGILATPVADTLKLGENQHIQQTVSRTNLWHALTPQLFRYQPLLDALQLCKNKGLMVTDEASAIEEAGGCPKLVSASYPNPKLTFEKDLKLIALLLTLEQEAMG